jgi:arylsulfate sulfotransferase
VVWYSPTPVTGGLGVYDVRQLANGDLFLQEQPPLNRFLEMNMLGENVRTWPVPAAYPIDGHEGLPTDHGTILYLSNVGRFVSNFPTNATDPNAPLGTVKVDDNPVVEISASDASLLNAWSPLDLLNPTRVTYLTFQFPSPFGVDNEHANAVIEDPRDNSIIVSLRDQHAVFKFLRSTGQLKWILGPHANWGPEFQQYLLTPVGTPFEWNYGQHAPEITPQGTLLLYDDGNDRACPFDPRVPDQANSSRAVEYFIDETNMQVSQVWDSSQIPGDRLFTPAVGDADYLTQSGNILITYGLISYRNGVQPSLYATNASMARIREVTHTPVPQVVFELSFFDQNNTNSSYLGCLCYRSDRIADLYAHPALPVADLAVSMLAGAPRLDFSADVTRTYTVEASSDLVR